MALGINGLSSTATATGNAQTHTSDAFSPDAGLVYIFAIAQNSAHTTTQDWSMTTSLGHTVDEITRPAQVPWDIENAFDVSVGLYVFEAAGTETNMTVTLDVYPGTQLAHYSMQVFEVTGDDLTEVQFAVNLESTGASGVEPHTSGTLGAAATSGNLVIACIGVSCDGPGAPNTPAGWTALATQAAVFNTASAFFRTDFTGDSVTWTSAGSNVGAIGSVLLEITEGGAGDSLVETPIDDVGITDSVTISLALAEFGVVDQVDIADDALIEHEAMRTADASPVAITDSVDIALFVGELDEDVFDDLPINDSVALTHLALREHVDAVGITDSVAISMTTGGMMDVCFVAGPPVLRHQALPPDTVDRVVGLPSLVSRSASVTTVDRDATVTTVSRQPGAPTLGCD